MKNIMKHFILKDLEQNLSNGHSPADLLINKYNGKWKKILKKYMRKKFSNEKKYSNPNG